MHYLDQYLRFNTSFLAAWRHTHRHFGGINYPKGGVGRIAEELADGGLPASVGTLAMRICTQAPCNGMRSLAR